MKNIIILISVLILSIGTLATGQIHASNESLKQQVEAMPSGNLLIERIDKFAALVGEKSKQDSEFRRTITMKIEKLQKKYKQKTDTKSKNVSIILSYLGEKISGELGITSSRILERFQKIEAESHKGKFQSRMNKVKTQDYQRIHLKK